MQNKGFIRVIAVLLTLICLFYISFSVVTAIYNNKAKEYAAGDEAKYKHYIDSISTEKVSWWYYTYQQCREMEIGLGLDLKGGMNVMLQISVADVLKSLSNNNPDPNFNAAIAAAQAAQAGNNDFIASFYDEYRKIDPNVRLSAIFSTFQLKDKITPRSTNEEVIAVLRNELNSAVDNSYNVLRTRIDRFGVVAPNIQKLEKDGLISIELPGIKEPERVRKLLQGSANLEFWETYKLDQLIAKLDAVNNALAAANASQATDSVAAETPVTEPAPAATDTTATAAAATGDSTAQSLKAKLQKEESDAEMMARFRKQNPLLSLMNYTQAYGGSPVIGIVNKNDTAAVNSMLSSKIARDILPSDLILRWTVKPIDEKQTMYQLIALKAGKGGKAPLGGDVITDARDDFDKLQGSVVSMTMNAEGAKTWEKLTRDNIGNAIAIVLDNQVYSFPNVNQAITGGSSQITGGFSPEEAKDLANVLKSGKMAASVTIVQEDIIGPSLGQEAIQNGLISFLVALVLLMAYLIIMYGWTPGLIASFGVICNLFFTVGILASLQAVLTLSGIAGIVLSLAMAVDANVLIFERTKEELRAGKNMKSAVADGYKNAFSAIFDSNLTSIITGVILLIYGTGPILGFATTLIIGIATSFFTAIFITRLIFEAGLNRGKFNNMTFTTAISRNFLTDTHINFVGLRKIGYICILAVIAVFVVSFFTRGMNQGIDFSGGRNYVVRFEQPVSPLEIENMLEPSFEGHSLSVITITSSNQVRISTNYRIADNGEEVDREIETKLYEGMKSLLGDTTYEEFSENMIQSRQKVGPTIADDIKVGAYWAVFFSLIAMALYILLRFRNIAFSAGTLVSVAFTTFSVVGLYSLLYGVLPFSMEIDQNFVAAVLTVIGYSVNDTVVIFDRIREEKTLYPKRDLVTSINSALNSTLPRTINTGQSTIIVLLCILLLGAESVRSFAFAMLFGVIIGTFSTLFVATPIAYEIQRRGLAKKAAKEAAAAK
ncbi:preprotein translocase subunit SecD [Barnesiella viscericola DSM 18177]|uniref:Multifunctional fusion protein n=1 Tax=Barnesiella viscericola DSM 18177 TaxID=880074 RepID=W0EU59_9BACT|nr:protein translocase subunit SecDF [Barnesiella viscericola]AHF12709.1 preprotein translocase subunit SecD [Barnesiella viscericola DSM 18177]